MSLKTLQKLSGVEPDGAFGKNTFKAASKFLQIPSRIGAVHFFAQCGHETGGFKVFEENLNYSASGLLKVFGKYFDTQTALEYERETELIANMVYANRMGNGSESSGDGWKYRGRGALQLTGKNNYLAFSEYVADDSVITDPDQVADKYAFNSAMFFFRVNKLWSLCEKGTDENTVKLLTKRINGGLNGFDHRYELTKLYNSY